MVEESPMSVPACCVICQSTDTHHFLAARDYISGETFDLRRCAKCGVAFVWPQPVDLNKY
jgi:hypothetical protein